MNGEELLNYIIKQLGDLIFKIENERKSISEKDLEIIIKNRNGKIIKTFYFVDDEKKN
jgi:hypothetical protein